MITSAGFVVAFLIFLCVYAIKPHKYLLLVASVLCYSFLGLRALLLLTLMTAMTFVFAYYLKRHRNTYVLWFFVLTLLVPFITYRMGQSFTGSWLLPLGLSYYTLQMLGYVIDVYNRRVENPFSLVDLFIISTYFPQLIQGPVVDYKALAETLFAPKTFHMERTLKGLQRMLWGYFKKVVIADAMFPIVQAILAGQEAYNGPYVLLLMILYTVQLYMDFSGGIDIVMGISQALGIHLPENFHRPFSATTVSEFWRRWHISLGIWFRTYVFYPLSTSRAMIQFTRRLKAKGHKALAKRFAIYVSTLFIWSLTGLWHGFTWHFLLWGLLNGLVILIGTEAHALASKKAFRLWEPIQMVRTFFWISSVRLLDCYQSVRITGTKWLSIFQWSYYVPLEWEAISVTFADALLLIGGVVFLIMARPMLEREKANKWLMMALFWGIVIFGAYGLGYEPQQFIYGGF